MSYSSYVPPIRHWFKLQLRIAAMFFYITEASSAQRRHAVEEDAFKGGRKGNREAAEIDETFVENPSNKSELQNV